MKLNKTFRFRMEPNAKQRERLERNGAARRWVWNWALGRKADYYRENGKGLPTSVLSAELPILKRKPETAWLADANAQSLQQTLRDLDRSLKGFFEKRARFPKFKSRKRDQPRFRIPQNVTVSGGAVLIPKFGAIRIRQSQEITGRIRFATFKRDITGNWDVYLVAEFTMPDVERPSVNPATVIGVDLGLNEFAVLSDGARVPIPRFYRQEERKLRKAQRVFDRRKKGSARKLRARRRVSLINRQIASRRKDFLHKVTSQLIGQYDGLCIEDLAVTALAKNKLSGHSKSNLDASFGEFRRQIKYKAVWNNRHLAMVDRWYPSTKTCHACGAKNDNLTMKDRSWTCVCGVCHDRDLNAALNIRTEGLRLMAAGHADSNARGLSVRLPQLEAVGVEA